MHAKAERVRSPVLSKIVAAGAIAVFATAPPLCAQEIPAGRSMSLHRFIATEAARLAKEQVHQAAADLQSQPTERSWIGRHPVLTGALIGATGGAVWAEILCRGQCEGDPRPYMALFGGAGAGIGAGVGGVIAAIRR
jgi:hypothetical protein